MLRCARVSEPVSYEGGIDKYVVKTKCQGRTTKVICDDEDAAWRFSAQWSHFRAGVSHTIFTLIQQLSFKLLDPSTPVIMESCHCRNRSLLTSV